MKLFLAMVWKKITDTSTGLRTVKKPENNMKTTLGIIFQPGKLIKRKVYIKIDTSKYPLPEKEVIVPGFADDLYYYADMQAFSYHFDPDLFVIKFSWFIKKFEQLYDQLVETLRNSEYPLLNEDRVEIIKNLLKKIRLLSDYIDLIFYQAGYYEVYKYDRKNNTVKYLKKTYENLMYNIELYTRNLEHLITLDHQPYVDRKPGKKEEPCLH